VIRWKVSPFQLDDRQTETTNAVNNAEDIKSKKLNLHNMQMQQLKRPVCSVSAAVDVIMYWWTVSSQSCRVVLMIYPRHHSSMLRQPVLLLLTMHCTSPSVCPVARQLGTLAVSTSLDCVESFVTDQWSVKAQCLTDDRDRPSDVHCIVSLAGVYFDFLLPIPGPCSHFITDIKLSLQPVLCTTHATLLSAAVLNHLQSEV